MRGAGSGTACPGTEGGPAAREAPPAGAVAAVLIAGPTTAGKSALAIRLAERLGGIVVNADSMQVYADLRILTARPEPAEEARVPHRLYGHVDGATNYSVGRYLADAGPVLDRAWREGLVPIVVGGTGLYFRALTDGLSAIPAVPEPVRAAIRASAEGRETPDLHARLAAADPDGARGLRPGDRQRILRALEVLAATGRPLASFHGERVPGPLAGRRVVPLRLVVDRALLRERIDGRFVAMVEGGALDEVSRLAARRLDPALPVMRAHGVPGLLAFQRGDVRLDEAIRRGQADTRAYAKRQATWARHQMADWIEAKPEDAEAQVLAAFAAGGVRLSPSEIAVTSI